MVVTKAVVFVERRIYYFWVGYPNHTPGKYHHLHQPPAAPALLGAPGGMAEFMNPSYWVTEQRTTGIYPETAKIITTKNNRKMLKVQFSSCGQFKCRFVPKKDAEYLVLQLHEKSGGEIMGGGEGMGGEGIWI